MKTLNMDDGFWESSAWVDDVIRDAAQRVHQQLIKSMSLVQVADPDGELRQAARILLQKRGCRRQAR
jgi:hypothetical protein